MGLGVGEQFLERPSGKASTGLRKPAVSDRAKAGRAGDAGGTEPSAKKGEGKTQGAFYAKNGFAYVPNPQGGAPIEIGLLNSAKVVRYVREHGLKAQIYLPGHEMPIAPRPIPVAPLQGAGASPTRAPDYEQHPDENPHNIKVDLDRYEQDVAHFRRETQAFLDHPFRIARDVFADAPPKLAELDTAQRLIGESRKALAAGDAAGARRLADQADRAYHGARLLFAQFRDGHYDRAEATKYALEVVRDGSKYAVMALSVVATAGAASGAFAAAEGATIFGTGLSLSPGAAAMLGTTAVDMTETAARLLGGERVDWGSVGADLAVTAIAAKFGGKGVGKLFNGVMDTVMKNPAAQNIAKPVVEKAVRGVVTSLVNGAEIRTLSTTIHALQQSLAGQKITADEFADQLIANLGDKKSILIDLALAGLHVGVEARGAAKAGARAIEPHGNGGAGKGAAAESEPFAGAARPFPPHVIEALKEFGLPTNRAPTHDELQAVVKPLRAKNHPDRYAKASPAEQQAAANRGGRIGSLEAAIRQHFGLQHYTGPDPSYGQPVATPPASHAGEPDAQRAARDNQEAAQPPVATTPSPAVRPGSAPIVRVADLHHATTMERPAVAPHETAAMMPQAAAAITGELVTNGAASPRGHHGVEPAKALPSETPAVAAGPKPQRRRAGFQLPYQRGELAESAPRGKEPKGDIGFIRQGDAEPRNQRAATPAPLNPIGFDIPGKAPPSLERMRFDLSRVEGRLSEAIATSETTPTGKSRVAAEAKVAQALQEHGIAEGELLRAQQSQGSSAVEAAERNVKHKEAVLEAAELEFDEAYGAWTQTPEFQDVTRLSQECEALALRIEAEAARPKVRIGVLSDEPASQPPVPSENPPPDFTVRRPAVIHVPQASGQINTDPIFDAAITPSLVGFHHPRVLDQFYGGYVGRPYLPPKIREGTIRLGVPGLFAVQYNKGGFPVTVAEHLTMKRIKQAKMSARPDMDFKRDPTVERGRTGVYHDLDDVTDRFDRGHCGASSNGATAQDKIDTFRGGVNTVAQCKWQNETVWRGIEHAVQELALEGHDLYVVTGPAFIGARIKAIPRTGKPPLLVPTHMYKAVYDHTTGKAAVYWSENGLPHDKNGRQLSMREAQANNFSKSYEVLTVAEFTERTGIDPFPALDPAIKNPKRRRDMLDLPPPMPAEWGVRRVPIRSRLRNVENPMELGAS